MYITWSPVRFIWRGMVSNGVLPDFFWIIQDTNVGFCCMLSPFIIVVCKKWPENSCAFASNVQVGDNWSSTSSVENSYRGRCLRQFLHCCPFNIKFKLFWQFIYDYCNFSFSSIQFYHVRFSDNLYNVNYSDNSYNAIFFRQFL